MTRNNRTNNLIKWMVILGDILLWNLMLLAFSRWHPRMAAWIDPYQETFWLASILALVVSEYRYHTIIHERLTSAGEVMRRLASMIALQAVLAYPILKVFAWRIAVGKVLLEIGACMFVLLLFVRFLERLMVKRYRSSGRNTRTVTFVGTDSEQLAIYKRLVSDPTTGYRPLGYYGEKGAWDIQWLGTVDDLLDAKGGSQRWGDDMFVCLPRREGTILRKLSNLCDQHLVRFYYVPVAEETFGNNLNREFLDDMEVYTTYEIPLENPMNRFLKRLFDIVFSSVLLLCMLPFLPIVALIIKWQSPGPIFFRQLRTGLDGRDFYCYKLRSMHVNKDADTVQATKDDPRKYAFGNFMRKANIDELPQFWNVLKGDMSIVGPRPHMLAHTEMYSQLIDKYMVRHFVKPGVTGWAQVTGFRGETRELWQMEERVKRDIWYMEHWNIWLDLRIIWLTIKSIIIHDKNAY